MRRTSSPDNNSCWRLGVLSTLEPVIVPVRDPVIVPVLEPVIVPVREPVIVPTRATEVLVLDPVMVPP
jgi:hypothetical protein